MTRPAKQRYEVQCDGWLYGAHYRKGEFVELYPKQAEHDLPPHGAMLAPAPAEIETKSAPVRARPAAPAVAKG